MTIATSFLVPHCTTSSQIQEDKNQRSPRKGYCTQLIPLKHSLSYPCLCSHVNNHGRIFSSLQYIIACASSSTPLTSSMSTRLYVSGLSFRTTRESLQNAFQKFGKLVEVNLVMDKIANRPKGFAFLRYETEEEAKNAIEGMHGKFLDGRVIFVEVAKPRSESGKNLHNSRNSQR